jgi:hypothetical protein
VRQIENEALKKLYYILTNHRRSLERGEFEENAVEEEETVEAEG